MDTTNNPSNKHPNRSAKNWLIYRRFDQALLRNSRIIRGVVYDLGCGQKPYESFIASLCDSYVGVDWGQSPHDVKADLISDLNKPLAINDQVADTVISFSVMEHLHESQLFLNEACRILKKDGSLMLETPWQWWVHEAPHDYYRYSPYALRLMLTKAGFKSIQIESQGGAFATLALKASYLLNRFVGSRQLKRYYFFAPLLKPLMLLMQLSAIPLDRYLDRNWELESPAYFIVAKK